jgi:hypothetical protein
MMKLATALAMCAGLVMMGCGTAEYDWNKAHAADTLTAYQTFLQHHGTGKYADEARGRILGLRDDQAWSLAQATDTIDGYQAYLQTESGGVHAPDARYKITALERAQAWTVAQKDGSFASLQAFLRKYPQGPESNEARQRLSALDFRVQLAAARSKSTAERERVKLQARFGSVVHDVVIVAPASSRAIYRVTSEPMSRADANSACAVLERSHQSCKLVQNEGMPG